ncbi:serine/threonine-protein kinase [Microbispora hainanensis]|uniref:non-specific serine/threonine protein kinase n=1 Tax=Microbispora hainanensis TaxID=568844 RepID=A0A544YCM5_9ACTN|nr:serine/threonine-protein kinase [Microbispora hainanensis]TQS14513.1 protein kinase [Microbispora hainanensis]
MTEGPVMPPLVGRRLGDYTVEAVVGRGGMATVYRARDQRLGRAVALKVLAPQLAHDDRFRDRFVRESRMVASIDHPNIIPVYEAGERDELLFIAMRYVEGSDLRKLVQSEGPLPVGRANPLFVQIASALDAAHAHGLVHRDVKPANILVTQADHVYLTDFGLTKSSSAEAGLTSHGHFMGTPRYVAPEQIRGLPVDGRSDLYAFACVVYEALAGQPPFQRDTELALLYAHVSHDPPPLTPYRPDLPHAVNAVLTRALAKSPAERFETCQAFVSALRDAISGGTGDPAAASPSYPPVTPSHPPVPSYPPVSHASPGSPVAQGSAGTRPQGSYPPGTPTSFPPGTRPPVTHPSHSAPTASSHPPVSQPTGAVGHAQGQGSYPPGSPHSQATLASAAAQGQRRGLPLGPLIGGLAILVSIAVAAALLLTKGGDTAATWNTYPGSTAAPFTMSYPSSWGEAKTNADQWMIASPAVHEFDDLFAVPGNTDWSKVNPIIKDQPDRAAGVFAQVSNALSTSDSPMELQESLGPALPGVTTYYGLPTAATVGAKPAFKIEGVLSDPQQGGRLEFVAYVVRQGDTGTTVLITFFCPPGKFNQSNIDHMVNSIAFTS